MPEPQPATLTATASKLSYAAIVSFASASASSSTPACICSEPQQRGRRGACTSQPSALSTRTVAPLTSPKNTRCTQPCMSATRPRRRGEAGDEPPGEADRAGVTSASCWIAERRVTGGASRSIA
jgi:hypothetical protein